MPDTSKQDILKQMSESAKRLQSVNDAVAKAAAAKQQGSEIPQSALPNGALVRRS